MRSAARASEPFVRETETEDCYELARRLRKDDVAEILHASGRDPERAVVGGYFESQSCFTVELNGAAIVIFGINGQKGIVGYPWMLATDGLKKIRKSFVRQCRNYVGLMLKEYGYLENHVWAKNAEHIKWLMWLGFEFDPIPMVTARGEPFLRFYMKDKNV